MMRTIAVLSAPTLMVCHFTIDLDRPALISLTGATPAPAQSLSHFLLDRLRALERQPVVHQRRRQQTRIDRLELGGLFEALVLHREVPAVDQYRVALNVALPCRVRPVCAAPVFPPDLYIYVCAFERER